MWGGGPIVNKNDVCMSLYRIPADCDRMEPQPLKGVRGPPGYGVILEAQGVSVPPEGLSPDPFQSVSEWGGRVVTSGAGAHLTGGTPVRYALDLFSQGCRCFKTLF